MKPFVLDGRVWRVVRVAPGDPALIDRTGVRTIATTDPGSRTIRLSSDIPPQLLDKVMLHEAAHAVSISRGLFNRIEGLIPEANRIEVEEWSAQAMAEHSLDTIAVASRALGRPVCIRGLCMLDLKDGKRKEIM